MHSQQGTNTHSTHDSHFNPRFFFPKYGAYAWFTGPHRTVEDSVSEVAEAGKAPGPSGSKDVDVGAA